MKDYSFGNHICSLRTGLGLSQFQLGNLVGVSDKAVSKWENGNSKPRISTCYRLAEVLGVSINELLFCENTSQARKETKNMDGQLWAEAYDRLHTIYGENPTIQCVNRLMYEENVLKQSKAIQNYKIIGEIKKLATKTKSPIFVDGFINSVFTAWLLGATEINPLPAHYYCPHCGKTIFVNNIKDGFDLPSKLCSCGNEFERDGHNIPFIGYAITEQQSGGQITIKASTSFCTQFIDFLTKFYSNEYHIVPVVQESDTTAILYIVTSKQKKLPSLNPDGFWYASTQEFFEWYNNELAFILTTDKDLDAVESYLKKHNLFIPKPKELLKDSFIDIVYKDLISCNPFFPPSDANFEHLIKGYGFLHSCNAWENNGEKIFLSGSAKLLDIPSCREDIWDDITSKLRTFGANENDVAIRIFEDTRKGYYCFHGMSSNIESTLYSLNLPKWYPEYLKKVRYLVSKRQCITYIVKKLLTIWYQNKNN